MTDTEAKKPFLELPCPRATDGLFEYNISDLISSFSNAAAQAAGRLPANEPETSRPLAKLRAIYDRSTKAVEILKEWQAAGITHITTKAIIAGGACHVDECLDYRFLEQMHRGEINMVSNAPQSHP